MSHDAAGELREYQRAEQLGLRQWDLFLNLGLLYLENQNTSAAIAALTTATKLGPRHPEAHFNLALAYERAGLLPAARREILASLNLHPDQPDAQNTLAVIYAGDGRLQRLRAPSGQNSSASIRIINLRAGICDFFEQATTNDAPGIPS